MELSYYPGCSLHGTSVEYDESTRAVCSELDIELNELEDWSCCGATSGHAIGGDLGLALPARNLAIAAKDGRDVVVPCAACFNRLRAAQVAAREGKLPDGIPAFDKVVDVRSLVDVIAAPEMLSRLAGKVKKTLEELSVVPYYGCLLVRPREVTGASDIEDPQDMDAVLKVLGVDLKTWSYKTQCCGGGLALPRADIVGKLVGKLLSMARRSGADCIVTACPMCLMNLETRQFEGLRDGSVPEEDSMPVLYFTELVGIALEMEWVSGWLAKHLMDPRPLLEKRGLL
jgi:heterodisulfide reductase subunit B